MKFKKDTYWRVDEETIIYIIEDPAKSSQYHGELMCRYKLWSTNKKNYELGDYIYERSYWEKAAIPCTSLEIILYTQK